MSTKTTFKRIALVAVAALGFGMLSVAPSTAVPQADTLTASALTATGLPGVAATVTITHGYLSTGTSDTVTATVSIVSMPATNTSLPVLASVAGTGTSVDVGSPVKTITGLAAATGSVAASTAVRGNYSLTLTSLVVGTYVFSVTPQVGSKATALTLTFTIGDTAVAPTAAASRVYMRSGAYNGVSTAPSLLTDNAGYAQVASVNNGGTVTYTSATLMTALGAHIATEDANISNVTTVSVAGGVATAGTTVATFGVILGNGETITASTISGAVQEAFGSFAPSASYYFNAAGRPVTATVTGPGNLIYGTSVKGKSYTEQTADGPVNYLQRSFSLSSDGTLGTSTITFTAGGVLLATRTVNFTGPLATLTVARAATFGGSSFAVGANTGAYVVTAKDANGTVLSGTTVYAYSGTVATATMAASVATGATGTASFVLTGVAAGTTAITFGNASTLATSTITATAAAEVTGSIATTVTLTTDKTIYRPGEKVTLTITAVDANGKPVADGARVLLATLISNIQLGGTALSTTTTLLGGVVTQSFFAPATPGTFTISGTKGAAALADPVSVTVTVEDAAAAIAQAAADAAAEAIDAGNNANESAVAAAEAAEAATAAAEEAGERAVAAAEAASEAAVAAAEAATDAANEALDAANAATDAANASAEAADAATAAAQDAADAVAALSVQVTEMIDALKKQITSLTNLVIKIQKKVKA